ncbi:MAG TPA: formate--tetrahydrofolate ligase, partial [Kofleriaceae bacterium]|nr:formate--tetrahydrofolate ligase [Kofleriaceae bacterium]
MISPPPTGPTDRHFDPLATAKPRPIVEIAARLGLQPDEIEPYGRFKAKLPLERIDLARAARSKLILISAVTPTPAGEGKTTTSIGLADGLARLGKRAVAVLREPSLGPVFGMKGGATGGGRARIVPHADINLHFNGDFSAVEKAHNLLAAIVDNHLHSRKSTLDLDPLSIRWKRVVDMNDRSLRRIVIGLGGQGSGVPRESGFDITAASEVMAILCLAQSVADLKERLGRIFIGFSRARTPIYARDLKAHGAMTALLREAMLPNLVQTLEGTPAI